jgi:hypothetical protein
VTALSWEVSRLLMPVSDTARQFAGLFEIKTQYQTHFLSLFLYLTSFHTYVTFGALCSFRFLCRKKSDESSLSVRGYTPVIY